MKKIVFYIGLAIITFISSFCSANSYEIVSDWNWWNTVEWTVWDYEVTLWDGTIVNVTSAEAAEVAEQSSDIDDFVENAQELMDQVNAEAWLDTWDHEFTNDWWSIVCNNWALIGEVTWTVSTSVQYWCSKYIWGWILSWTQCQIAWNWDSNWNKVPCVQNSNYTPYYISCWYKVITTTCTTDEDWNETCTTNIWACIYSWCRPNATMPQPKTRNRQIGLQYKDHNCADKPADWITSCNINFELSNIPAEWLLWFELLKAKVIAFSDWFLDQTKKVWDKWIKFFPASILNNKLSISLTSIVPLDWVDWDLAFKMEWKTWFSDLKQNLNLTIKKPVRFSDLTVNWIIDENWNTIKDKPEVWLEQEYNIELEKDLSLVINWDAELDLSENSISTKDTDWNDTFVNVKENPVRWNLVLRIPWVLNKAFNLILDVKNWASWNVFKVPKVGLDDKVAISYEVIGYPGKIVKYYLDEFDWIKWCQNRAKTLWLKVIWWVQYDWKWNLTWQSENSTDLSTTNVRNQIRKNAYNLLLNREDTKWEKVWKVYYDIWDKKYSIIESDLKKGDTVIVKDGNFIIDKDININKKIWVIVLNGDIYINKDVENINSVIYADWSLFSADENGKRYDDSEIYKPLSINGSIFTKNTVWWAIAWNWASNTYKLPWQWITNDFKEAEKYDLNFLRKADLCPVWSYSLKVTYDPYYTLYPPKGFWK